MTHEDEMVFQCQKCGHCCEGRGGIVVSPTDLTRLTAFLHVDTQTFVELYAEYSGEKMKIRVGDDGRCIFFKDGEGCTVHRDKPSICRAWPYFRGNIEDPISLALAKEFCPGISSQVSHETFAKAGRAYLQEESLLARDSEHEANALILESFE